MNDHNAPTHTHPTFPQIDTDPETMRRHLIRARRLRAEATADVLAHIGRIVLWPFRRPLGTRSTDGNETGRRPNVDAPQTDAIWRYGWSERPSLGH